jgi:phenylacetate-CoA ligase
MKLPPEIELQSLEKIKFLQEEKLRILLGYLSLNSPFYKALFASHRIDINSIKSLDDISLIPPTTKDQLQLYNWDFLCVPRERIIEYTTTSGTLGKPVTIGLTENDLQRLAYNEYISFACATGTSEDIYQLMITLDRQFMAGVAYYEGIRKLGAGLVRVGPGLPAMQLETIQRLKPTVLVSVPSFIVKLIEFATHQGIDLNKSSVRNIICIGESLRTADLELNALGQKIREAWDVHLYSTYASTEMQTAFTECRYGQGGHHHPELVHVELLDDNDLPVKNGQTGEVTITTFGVEGMPLIRYKTGDMARVFTECCECGRTTLRMGPILGRKQQMIKLKGTTIYPQGIFEILQKTDHVHDYVVEAYTGFLGTDELKLFIVVPDAHVARVESNLKAVFQSQIKVIPEIIFSTASELEQKQSAGRKIKKFIDHRIYL